MAVTEEREQIVSFTDPYYLDGAQFFAKKDLKIKDISELKDGTVGVVIGTTFHTYLSKMNNVREILYLDSDVDNVKSVEIGRADGLVTGKLVGLYSAKRYNVDIEPIGEPLYQEKIAIAIRQEDTVLLMAVNKALREIKEDGTYEKISKKWFGRNIL
jgi:polar amino acid transport system substrate-binding protein